MKGFVFLLSAALISLPSFAGSFKIGETLKVHKEIEADLYEVPFLIEVRSGEEDRILNVLNAVDNAVRLLGLDYEGGKFSLRPFKDKSGRTLLVGRLHYLFRLKNPSTLSRILNTFENLKKNYPEMTYSVGAGTWTVEPARVEKIRDSLRMELFKKVRAEVVNLSETFGAECRIAELRLSERNPSFVPFRVDLPNPVRERVKVELRADVVFECYR